MHLPGDGKDNLLKGFRIGPLLYVTDLSLPELPAATAKEGEIPVIVRLARAPDSLEAPLASSASCEANESEFLLRLPGVATYYVRDGVEVVIDRAFQAPELDVRSYLMGNLFAVLCHQRGLLPLHASAIATPAGAVAFLGESGAGKSSLVAFLARRGHRILADDICLVDPGAPRNRRVLPVAPWLKLWSTTLDALGTPSTGLARIFSDDDKYRYALQTEERPTALAELVLLERPGEGDTVSGDTVAFQQVPPARALHAVLGLTYQSWLVAAIGQTETYFLRCGQALEGVRVTSLRRPWGFAAMEATLTALERHLKNG